MTIPLVIYLDRDGTINIDSGYVRDPDSVELIAGAAKALGDLKRAGFKLVVVSNQSGIARGLMTESDVQSVNQKVQALLLSQDADAEIDEVLYCPHAPDNDCACRKPKTGLVKNPPSDCLKSYIVGDKLSDIEFGANLGIPRAQRILVLTGKGESEWQKFATKVKERPEKAASIVEAAEYILTQIETK